MNFVLCVYNLDYKGEEYLKACIASIHDSGYREIYVCYKNISTNLIDEIGKKYPVVFVEYPDVLHLGYQPISLKLTMNQWFLERFQGIKDICFMDIDCLVLQPMPEVFEQEFDIAYTPKTNVNVIKYRTPLNCGVLFVRNNEKTRILFYIWKSKVEKLNVDKQLCSNAEKVGGGLSQFSFMEILEKYGSPFSKILKLNDHIYNLHIDWEEMTDETKVFHHKGGVWRSIIFDRKIRPHLEGGYNIWERYRKLYDNK